MDRSASSCEPDPQSEGIGVAHEVKVLVLYNGPAIFYIAVCTSHTTDAPE